MGRRIVSLVLVLAAGVSVACSKPPRYQLVAQNVAAGGQGATERGFVYRLDRQTGEVVLLSYDDSFQRDEKGAVVFVSWRVVGPEENERLRKLSQKEKPK